MNKNRNDDHILLTAVYFKSGTRKQKFLSNKQRQNFTNIFDKLSLLLLIRKRHKNHSNLCDFVGIFCSPTTSELNE